MPRVYSKSPSSRATIHRWAVMSIDRSYFVMTGTARCSWRHRSHSVSRGVLSRRMRFSSKRASQGKYSNRGFNRLLASVHRSSRGGRRVFSALTLGVRNRVHQIMIYVQQSSNSITALAFQSQVSTSRIRSPRIQGSACSNLLD